MPDITDTDAMCRLPAGKVTPSMAPMTTSAPPGKPEASALQRDQPDGGCGGLRSIATEVVNVRNRY